MADHSRLPGEFPEVHDEAPPTPTWVPLLGLGILAALTFFAVYRSATAPEEPALETIEIGETPPEEGGEGAPAEAAQPAQPAAPAAPPAQPAAPGGAGADSHGRQPGDEHFGHDHP